MTGTEGEMSEVAIPILRRVAFDHTILGADAPVERVLLERIALPPYARARLIVTVHDRDIDPGGGYELVLRRVHAAHDGSGDCKYVEDLCATPTITGKRGQEPTLAICSTVIGGGNGATASVLLRASGAGWKSRSLDLLVSADLKIGCVPRSVPQGTRSPRHQS